MQVSWERCLQSKFSLLFSVSQLQKIFLNEEKPPINHKLTLSKASHNGVTNHIVAWLVQRTSFKRHLLVFGNRDLFSWNQFLFRAGLYCSSAKIITYPRRLMKIQQWLRIFSTARLSWLLHLFFNRRCQRNLHCCVKTYQQISNLCIYYLASCLYKFLLQRMNLSGSNLKISFNLADKNKNQA